MGSVTCQEQFVVDIIVLMWQFDCLLPHYEYKTVYVLFTMMLTEYLQDKTFSSQLHADVEIMCLYNSASNFMPTLWHDSVPVHNARSIKNCVWCGRT